MPRNIREFCQRSLHASQQFCFVPHAPHGNQHDVLDCLAQSKTSLIVLPKASPRMAARSAIAADVAADLRARDPARAECVLSILCCVSDMYDGGQKLLLEVVWM